MTGSERCRARTASSHGAVTDEHAVVELLEKGGPHCDLSILAYLGRFLARRARGPEQHVVVAIAVVQRHVAAIHVKAFDGLEHLRPPPFWEVPTARPPQRQKLDPPVPQIV